MSIRFSIAFLSVLASVHVAVAEPCHEGDVEATTDQELHVLAGVTCLDGSLELGGNVAKLGPLKKLTEIKGNLRIARAERLSSLRGLDALVRVGGELSIGGPKAGVPKLRNIDGLRGLVEIGGDLWISGGYIFEPGKSRMSPIDGVDGLTSLARVGGTVHLFDVRAFRGMNALVEIAGNLEVEHGDFTVLAGFKKLERIGGSILFKNNQKLIRIDAAPKLATVGGDVVVDCHNEDDPSTSLRLTEKTVRARFEKVAVTGTVWRLGGTDRCWIDPRRSRW
jgi:hypothetical protein